MALQYLGRGGRAIAGPRSSGASGRFFFEVNKADIARIQKKLDSVQGRPMRQRIEKKLWAEGDVLASKVKTAAPRGPTGNLKKAINARRLRAGALTAAVYGVTIAGVLVGPRHKIAPHRHLVIRGTRVRPVVGRKASSQYRVLPGMGQSGERLSGLFVLRRESIPDTGQMRPNPFVDRATARAGPAIARAVAHAWTQTL